MEMSLSAAARATGRSKSTLSRAIKSGRLSARRAESGGGWIVDAAELHRVYPVEATTTEAPLGEAPPASRRATQPPDEERGEASGAIALLEQALAYERAALQREREVTTDLRERLDRSEERGRAFLGQPVSAPAAAAAAAAAPAAPRSFLARLLGR